MDLRSFVVLKFIVVINVFLLPFGSNGQAMFLGNCPKVASMKNFDVSRVSEKIIKPVLACIYIYSYVFVLKSCFFFMDFQYSGKWFEIEKYWSVMQAGSSCVLLETFDQGNSSLAVIISRSHQV